MPRVACGEVVLNEEFRLPKEDSGYWRKESVSAEPESRPRGNNAAGLPIRNRSLVVILDSRSSAELVDDGRCGVGRMESVEGKGLTWKSSFFEPSS